MSQLPYNIVPSPGDLTKSENVAAFVNRINSALQKVQQRGLEQFTPTSSNSPGKAGRVTYDATNLYVWVQENTPYFVALTAV